MNFFFPKFGALCMAENCTCHLHNLYTPRGAQVRDAKAWSFYIDEAMRPVRAATPRCCSPATTGRAGAATRAEAS